MRAGGRTGPVPPQLPILVRLIIKNAQCASSAQPFPHSALSVHRRPPLPILLSPPLPAALLSERKGRRGGKRAQNGWAGLGMEGTGADKSQSTEGLMARGHFEMEGGIV